MAPEQVAVPVEVHEGLEALDRDGSLDPDDREQAIERADEEELIATRRWLERVGEDVYERASTGAFTVDDGEDYDGGDA